MVNHAIDINDEPLLQTPKVFVTGASGLVGSHLVRQLVKEGVKVKAIYRTAIPGFADSEQVEWVKGDILDILFLEDVLANVKQVYHCAAVVSFHPRDKRQLFQVNVEGTANVVNAALSNNINKLCYVSSVAALAKNKKGEEITEDAVWVESNVESIYAKSKYLAEMEVWRGIGEGLNAVIVNPSIILGATDWNISSGKIFKTAYEEFPYYAEGITGFVDVQDVVDAMIQLMNSNVSNERFILSAENVQYRKVFSSIATAFHKKPPYKKVTPLMASLVTLFGSIKSALTGGLPLLTKETADAAQSKVYYNNSKIKSAIPSFTFTPIEETIVRVCEELKVRYSL